MTLPASNLWVGLNSNFIFPVSKHFEHIYTQNSFAIEEQLFDRIIDFKWYVQLCSPMTFFLQVKMMKMKSPLNTLKQSIILDTESENQLDINKN